jgi:hypothetical protein
MKTYLVEIQLVDYYELIIQADTKKDAEQIAYDLDDPSDHGERYDGYRKVLQVNEA